MKFIITITNSGPQMTAHICKLHCAVNSFTAGQVGIIFPNKLHNTHYSEAIWTWKKRLYHVEKEAVS